MFSAIRHRKTLSRLEHLVMDVVWRRGPVTADAVREALSATHPMKESTARTVLKRLEDKGYLARRLQGRTNAYLAREAPERVAAGAVRQLVDKLCGGSVERLLVSLVDDEVIDAAELRRLARKIAARETKEGERNA
ncbi:MAG: BlaI/MecI/CopY family transcriptional regulator [Bryobacteraceae bacterium]|nr:BlaI/MecI/CopY family transcriptional regulator [Bryobacteraceae bacterium]